MPALRVQIPQVAPLIGAAAVSVLARRSERLVALGVEGRERTGTGQIDAPSRAGGGLAVPQGIVRIKDAVSNRPVVLIGTMHYNPHSVALVQGALRAAARRG